MRPGTSLIEIRAYGWWGSGPKGFPNADMNFWGNFYMARLWYTNSTFYWWYGANDTDSWYNDEELSALKNQLIKGMVARDKDVRVYWDRLKCTLATVIGI